LIVLKEVLSCAHPRSTQEAFFMLSLYLLSLQTGAVKTQGVIATINSKK
jgi:hypothetical protein